MNRRRKTFRAAAINYALCIKHCALIMALCINVACTSDEDASQQLPAGKYPLELTAANISVTQTRANTVNNAWTVNDEVGVSVSGDNGTYTYTVGSDGKLTGTNPYYWKNTSDKITVTAWYPYNNGKDPGTSWTVQQNQSTDEKYQASDFIKATATDVTFGSTATLNFTHQVAKITVSLSKGTGVTDTELSSATVYIYDGKQYITSHSGSALVMPTTLSAKKDFIKVTINGKDFVYTLEENKTFEAGNAYAYTITVSKAGLELEGCTIGDWETGTGDSNATIESLTNTFKTMYNISDNNVLDLSTLTSNTEVSGNVLLTGSTEKKITIAAGATVVLLDAHVTVWSGSAIKCNGNATIYIEGENTAKVTIDNANTKNCGIEAGGSGTTLTIDTKKGGSLTATGASMGAGIGSGYQSTCGDITIKGGTVTAKGGGWGAGIGSGYDGASCGNITISGGTVTATRGQDVASIGTGYNSSCGNITINGGTVNASYIGNVNGKSCGTITYSGGAIVNGTKYN